ncbi:protein-L-isoaspartate O-methyltransferase [Halarchaeum acidiphilum MH1-52-1]|uniref:protein-L-isoaspartate(D-aspartate) O-methyltransferase n=1 Tax=Halarchaeum acidiphilum MH1-52-1 TaxID=1261545 RepID=U2YDE2_9EURY|nr:protein-L-isoaspartate O-methyltransferase [Halarchaeum acidiphilum]GAD51696.1 protein-L-isoaspartate O-methyltransferase [Halarchaeum acidiphilum MH1-52-1]
MEYAAARDGMVDSLEHELRGVVEPDPVGTAMRAVPRHEFVDEADHRAYNDRSFEQYGTRVLAPSTAGALVQALAPEPGHDVLVVGAGVGYTSAVLAEIVGDEGVHAVDIARRVVWAARDNLRRAGYGGALVDRRDGARGFPEYAPFDRILVEAAAVDVPRALRDQLAPDGRLVMPLGAGEQRLAVVDGSGVVREGETVSFDPLLVEGEQGGVPVRNRTAREDREHARRHAERRRGWEHDWIEWD